MQGERVAFRHTSSTDFSPHSPLVWSSKITRTEHGRTARVVMDEEPSCAMRSIKMEKMNAATSVTMQIAKIRHHRLEGGYHHYTINETPAPTKTKIYLHD